MKDIEGNKPQKQTTTIEFWQVAILACCCLVSLPFGVFAQSPPVAKLPQGHCTPGIDLIEAIRRNDICSVERVLKKGHNINYESSYWGPPLYLASMLKEVEIVKLLLSHGAKVNDTDRYGNAPLHAANLAIARLLADKGANINAKNDMGETPLHYAHNELSKFLISKGADVNARSEYGETPLYRLILNDEADSGLIEFFIDHGADFQIAGNDGTTPLHHARKIGIVKLLVKRGADVNARDRYGRSPLLIFFAENVMDSGDPRDIEIPEFLIQSGADVNARDKYDRTPLQVASRYERKEIMKILKAAGAKE